MSAREPFRRTPKSSYGAGADPTEYDAESARLARARDRDATARDAAAEERDRVAALGDREADIADATADGFDRAEAARAAHEPRRAPHSRTRATLDRAAAFMDRELATGDRQAAVRDRQTARMLMSAVMLSSAFDHTSANTDEDRLWNMSTELLALANFDGSLTRLSSSWERALGYTQAELVGRSYLELVHPDDVEQTAARAGALLNPGYAAVTFENRCRAKDGGYRALVWSARTSSPPPVIYFVVHDVTDERTAALALHTAPELLRNGFDCGGRPGRGDVGSFE
jgi:PAS domain S-box-containing protein